MNFFRTHYIAVHGSRAAVIDSSGNIIVLTSNEDNVRGMMKVLGVFRKAIYITGKGSKIERDFLFRVEDEIVENEFIPRGGEHRLQKLFNVMYTIFPTAWPHKMGYARVLLMAEMLRRIFTGEDYEVHLYELPSLQDESPDGYPPMPRVQFQPRSGGGERLVHIYPEERDKGVQTYWFAQTSREGDLGSGFSGDPLP